LAREHSDPDAAVAAVCVEIERTKFQLETADKIHNFETSLEFASKDPGFMGILSASDANREFERFREGHYVLRSYFFYLEQHKIWDRFALCCAVNARTTRLVTGVRSTNVRWESILHELIFWCGHTPIPIDRRKCVVFEETAKTRAIAAINCWLVCAKRLRVVRDMRCLIAKVLWADRHEWIQL
jgi:hypothetical protein